MRPLRWLATSAVAFTTVAGAAESVKPARAAGPNILVILADDMGYGDLGCMGSEHLRTPHLDALASRGIRFTQAYVPSAVCSPSRAGILTGRDPRRFGYEGNLNKNAESYAANPALLGLPESEITMASHLREAGYSTALIGKWHQGVQPQFHPNRRGFDHFVGMLGGGHDYVPDPEDNQLERNGAPSGSFSSPYLTDFLTDEGLAWLTSQVA
ncbi:MAG: sulfatase-like hydrolase/transferase, partial [Planctomycetota bacterium]